MRDDFWQAMGGREKALVKFTRSRKESRLVIILKGGIETTEATVQKVYHSICDTVPQRSGGQ
jgi:hypothetical protein